jgi:hypothetical protein
MKVITWSALYQALPNGRFKISRSGLVEFEEKHADRILDTYLWGKQSRVLLFDQPLKLGGRVLDSKTVEFSLRPVRLNELPGWPPKMASTANVRALPALMECRLRGAEFSHGTGPGQEALELRLEHAGKKFRAWQVACPLPLLKCAEATLNQGSVVGRTLEEIQDANLIGGE